MTSNALTEKKPAAKQGKILQVVLSLIIFAGFVVFLFVPDLISYETSLFTQILNVFKNEFIGSDFSKIAMYAAVGMYAVLLICTIASFFTKRNAAAALNFIKTIVAVAVTALLACSLIRDFGLTASEIFYSEKTYLAINSVSLSMTLGLVALAVLSIATYKGKGVVKLFGAILAAGFFVFSYYTFIGEFTFSQLFGKITLGTGTVATISAYVFRILAWATLANLALSVLGFAFRRTSTFDLIRSCIMLALALAACILFGIYSSFGTLFKTIGLLGFAGVALAQFVYWLIVVCVLHSRRKKLAAEKENAANAFVFDENNQMTFAGIAGQPAQAADAQAAADTANAETAASDTASAQPAAQESNPDADTANKAFEDAAQISFDEIAKSQAQQEESAYENAIRDEAEPMQEQEEEKPFDFNQAKYDGKFNRQYADFAAEQEQAGQQQSQAQPDYTAQQPYQSAPPFYGNAYQQPYQQPYTQQGNGYYNTGFIPDGFISSLTPAEKDEFDRLFISRVYGDNKRLPAYRIGGDNREFFTKIFVFMGRYRNVISDGLLEKIYNYSNSIR